MFDKRMKVMVYVNHPRVTADFWIQKIGFVEVEVTMSEGAILSVEISPNSLSSASIVLFDRAIVEKMSPEINLGTPSLMFTAQNLQDMRIKLVERGVPVGDIVQMGGNTSFNFSDPEGNYFAVQAIE